MTPKEREFRLVKFVIHFAARFMHGGLELRHLPELRSALVILRYLPLVIQGEIRAIWDRFLAALNRLVLFFYSFDAQLPWLWARCA